VIDEQKSGDENFWNEKEKKISNALKRRERKK
jgi:hypothetical protein